MKKFLLMALVAMLPAATFAQEEEDTENGVVSVAGKEGFKIATKKGDFVFKPYMMVQASGNFNYYDDEGLDKAYNQDNVANSGFTIPYAIIGFTGKAFDKVSYNVSVNAAGSGGNILQQAWFDVKFKEQLALKVGKMKTPFAHGFQTTLGYTLMPCVPTSLTAAVILPHSLNAVTPSMNTGWDIGVELHGLLAKKFGYEVGLFNGTGGGVNGATKTFSDDWHIPSLLYAARFTFMPKGVMPNIQGDPNRLNEDKMLFGVRNNGYAFLCWVGTTAGVNFNPAIGSSGNVGNKTGNTAPGLYVSQTPSGGIRHFRLFATGESYAAGAAVLSMQTASLRDGLWHHIAVSYTNHTATLTVDYERSASATMTIAPTNEPVALLLPYSGAFHSVVSCIRVTKRALSSRDFMISTDCADCYPRTAFHWALDGVSGEEADGVVSNREYVAAAYEGFNTNLVGIVANGLGVYGVDTNGNRAAFCDSLPNGPRKNVAWEGFGRLGDDRSSLYLKTTPLSLSTMQSDKVVLWTSGTAITSSNSCPPVTGSFTMEMFAKFNFNDWRTNTQYVTRKRTTLMGLADGKQPSKYYIWSLEVTPNLSGGSADTFKMNAYNSDGALKTNGVDGKGVGARFSYLGGWHHIAVTYDEADYTMRLYVDYEQVGAALALGAPLLSGMLSGHVYYVGGGLNNHSFDGWVDEVRLVRECLPPEKFIRLNSDPGLKIIFK